MQKIKFPITKIHQRPFQYIILLGIIITSILMIFDVMPRNIILVNIIIYLPIAIATLGSSYIMDSMKKYLITFGQLNNFRFSYDNSIDSNLALHSLTRPRVVMIIENHDVELSYCEEINSCIFQIKTKYSFPRAILYKKIILESLSRSRSITEEINRLINRKKYSAASLNKMTKISLKNSLKKEYNFLRGSGMETETMQMIPCVVLDKIEKRFSNVSLDISRNTINIIVEKSQSHKKTLPELMERDILKGIRFSKFYIKTVGPVMKDVDKQVKKIGKIYNLNIAT